MLYKLSYKRLKIDEEFLCHQYLGNIHKYFENMIYFISDYTGDADYYNHCFLSESHF